MIRNILKIIKQVSPKSRFPRFHVVPYTNFLKIFFRLCVCACTKKRVCREKIIFQYNKFYALSLYPSAFLLQGRVCVGSIDRVLGDSMRTACTLGSGLVWEKKIIVCGAVRTALVDIDEAGTVLCCVQRVLGLTCACRDAFVRPTMHCLVNIYQYCLCTKYFSEYYIVRHCAPSLQFGACRQLVASCLCQNKINTGQVGK